jgi:hypothetical protein
VPSKVQSQIASRPITVLRILSVWLNSLSLALAKQPF